MLGLLTESRSILWWSWPPVEMLAAARAALGEPGFSFLCTHASVAAFDAALRSSINFFIPLLLDRIVIRSCLDAGITLRGLGVRDSKGGDVGLGPFRLVSKDGAEWYGADL
jgi:hypothetical protein